MTMRAAELEWAFDKSQLCCRMLTAIHSPALFPAPPSLSLARSITICNTPTEKTMRTVSFRLDADADALLRALCQQLGASQTDVIRRALQSLAGQGEQTPGTLGAELGLPGFFAGTGSGAALNHSTAVKTLLTNRRLDQRPANVAAAPVGMDT